MRQEIKDYLVQAGFIVAVIGVVVGIYSLNIPEGLKYFFITGFFLILFIMYIQTTLSTIVERIETIEEKIKKIEEKIQEKK